MPAGSADRNRSPIVNVTTPRGRIDVMHQEMRGLGSRSGWTKFWLARRTGTHDWAEATTPREAIRRAVLLPAKKTPGWLDAAVQEAERQLELADAPRRRPIRTKALSAPLRTEPFRLRPRVRDHVCSHDRTSMNVRPAAMRRRSSFALLGRAAGGGTRGRRDAQPAPVRQVRPRRSPPRRRRRRPPAPGLVRRSDPVTSVAARAVVTQRPEPAIARVPSRTRRRATTSCNRSAAPGSCHAIGTGLYSRPDPTCTPGRAQPGRHPGDDRPDDLRRGLDSHGPPPGEHHRAGEGREHGRLRRHRLARRLRVRPLRAARARRRDERSPQPVARAGRVAEPEGRGRERATPAGVRRADDASPRRSARSSPTGCGSPNRPRHPRRAAGRPVLTGAGCRVHPHARPTAPATTTTTSTSTPTSPTRR